MCVRERECVAFLGIGVVRCDLRDAVTGRFFEAFSFRSISFYVHRDGLHFEVLERECK